MSNRATQFYPLALAANGTDAILAEGSYFRILSSSGAVQVRPDGGSSLSPLYAGQGQRREFKRLTVTDVSGVANNVVIIVADDDFIDDRITGSVEVIDGGKSRVKTASSFIGGIYCGAVAGNYSMVQLWNPAGSGKNLVLAQTEYSCKTLCGMYLAVHNAALTTLLGQPANKLTGAAAGVGVTRVQNNAALLGTSILYFHVLASSPQILRLGDPMVITPGYGVQVMSDTLNVEVAASFEWYEEPV